MERLTAKGELGWLGLAAYVIAWDMGAQETLSSAFGRGLEKHQALVLGGLAVTCLHLLGALPAAIDPFHRLGQLNGRLHNGA